MCEKAECIDDGEAEVEDGSWIERGDGLAEVTKRSGGAWSPPMAKLASDGSANDMNGIEQLSRSTSRNERTVHQVGIVPAMLVERHRCRLWGGSPYCQYDHFVTEIGNPRGCYMAKACQGREIAKKEGADRQRP